MTEQKFMVIDYETYSEADITEVGAYEYSIHPSTEILCAAWKVGTKAELRKAKIEVYSPPLKGDVNKSRLMEGIADPKLIKVAHNALFEQCITANVLGVPTKPQNWVCTASMAGAMALPRKLEKAAIALELPVQKDMEGHRLMLKLSQPRKPTKHDPSTRHLKTSDMVRLLKYCITDIDTEVELFLRLNPLTPLERKVWILDQYINMRGVQVDRELVEKIIHLMEIESGNLLAEIHELTDGEIRSTKQVAKSIEWLARNDCYIPNMQAGTVAEYVKEGIAEGPALRLLELRQEMSKTSTAKYVKFESRSRSDGRVRDHLVYHGADTGRWSGSGVQLQNLARPKIKNTEILKAVDIVKKDPDPLYWLRLIYGSPFEMFSNMLRSVLVAPAGRVFDVADFASIEARVLFWLAKHEKGLEAFRKGGKLYEALAAVIYGKKADEITKEGIERFVGKTATLGCGFQMGPPKFQMTCANQGVNIPLPLAEMAVKAYRTTHWPVPKLWKDLETAAIAAVQNPGKVYKVNYVEYFVKNKILYCRLPSGRCLSYHRPTIEFIDTQWGYKKATLTYWAVDGLTKQLAKVHSYGGLLTENAVQAIARDIMVNSMLGIEETKRWMIVLTVHDELISERVDPSATNDDYCKLMATPPKWAPDCPIAVEGWSGDRYKK